MNGPEMNDDDIDGTLEQAGDRLRGEAPTAADARDAYNARRPLNGDKAEAGPGGRRGSGSDSWPRPSSASWRSRSTIAPRRRSRHRPAPRYLSTRCLRCRRRPPQRARHRAPTPRTRTARRRRSTRRRRSRLVRPEPQPGCGDAGLQESSTEYVVVVACRVLDSDGTSAAIAARLPKPASSSVTLVERLRGSPPRPASVPGWRSSTGRYPSTV